MLCRFIHVFYTVSVAFSSMLSVMFFFPRFQLSVAPLPNPSVFYSVSGTFSAFPKIRRPQSHPEGPREVMVGDIFGKRFFVRFRSQAERFFFSFSSSVLSPLSIFQVLKTQNEKKYLTVLSGN